MKANFNNIKQARLFIQDWELQRASKRLERAKLRCIGYTKRYELLLHQRDLTRVRRDSPKQKIVIQYLIHKILCLRKQLIKESREARQDSGRI